MAWTKREQQDAKERLIFLLRDRRDLYTILRHVSRSGMVKVISVILVNDGGARDISSLVARATDSAYDTAHEGVKVHGVNHNARVHLTDLLAYRLFGDTGEIHEHSL